MVTILANPIDVWLKKIGFDIFGQPLYGMVDKDSEVKAQLAAYKLDDGKLKFALKGEKSRYVFVADWQPPDDEIENALCSFFEQLVERTLNLSYRGEWNENRIQEWHRQNRFTAGNQIAEK
jgi:hypothetical protein